VTDDKGRNYIAFTADGMKGGVQGDLKIQIGQLRVISWSSTLLGEVCHDLPAQCPPTNLQYKVFISDPINLKDIPGEADKG
jgi:hypothetical protein